MSSIEWDTEMDVKMVMRTKFIRNIALIVLLGSCSALQAATMYKWVDDEGNVHYDQSPPSDRESEKLESDTGTKAATPPAAPADQPPVITEDENTRIKQQNCEAARRNQDIYKRSEKIRQPDGTELVMSDELRAEKLRQVEEDIKKFCQ